MIRGTVFPNRQALLAVALLDPAGQFQSFEFILDTGFDGNLSLPRRILQRLDARPAGRLPIELADGSRTTTPTWRVTSLWDGERRMLTIMDSGGGGGSLCWE